MFGVVVVSLAVGRRKGARARAAPSSVSASTRQKLNDALVPSDLVVKQLGAIVAHGKQVGVARKSRRIVDIIKQPPQLLVHKLCHGVKIRGRRRQARNRAIFRAQGVGSRPLVPPAAAVGRAPACVHRERRVVQEKGLRGVAALAIFQVGQNLVHQLLFHPPVRLHVPAVDAHVVVLVDVESRGDDVIKAAILGHVPRGVAIVVLAEKRGGVAALLLERLRNVLLARVEIVPPAVDGEHPCTASVAPCEQRCARGRAF